MLNCTVESVYGSFPMRIMSSIPGLRLPLYIGIGIGSGSSIELIYLPPGSDVKTLARPAFSARLFVRGGDGLAPQYFVMAGIDVNGTIGMPPSGRKLGPVPAVPTTPYPPRT